MAEAGFDALDKRGFRPAASDLGIEDLKAVFMAMYLVAPVQHSDRSLGLAELGLPLAVLKEAFTSSDSAQRVANLDVARTVAKAYSQFERVRLSAMAVLADLEQANHRIARMGDALRNVQNELDGETPEDIDYGTVSAALALSEFKTADVQTKPEQPTLVALQDLSPEEWAGFMEWRKANQAERDGRCKRCAGYGTVSTGIEESPTTICDPCNGTGKVKP